MDAFAMFEIKNQMFKSFVYFGFLIGAPIVLFLNIFSVMGKYSRFIGMVFPVIILFYIFIKGPLLFIFSSGAWSTQEVLFENGHFASKKIEFQMQDLGGRGYNKRTVDVLYLTNLFMITNKVPDNIDKRVEWV